MCATKKKRKKEKNNYLRTNFAFISRTLNKSLIQFASETKAEKKGLFSSISQSLSAFWIKQKWLISEASA